LFFCRFFVEAYEKRCCTHMKASHIPKHPETMCLSLFINVQWRFEYISLPADFAEYTYPPPEAFGL
jgi:hypothetical protein